MAPLPRTWIILTLHIGVSLIRTAGRVAGVNVSNDPWYLEGLSHVRRTLLCGTGCFGDLVGKGARGGWVRSRGSPEAYCAVRFKP